MSYRGRGGGRGGWRGGGAINYRQVSFPLFPEYEGLGKAKFKTDDIQLIKWSGNLRNYWTSSPYYYEDRTQHNEKRQKLDIERYSDRNLQATRAKPPLWEYIKLDPDHVPAELARGEKNSDKRLAKRVRWNPESGMQKFDVFEKLEQKQGGAEDKVGEEEDEVEEEEDEGEFSDDGDYEQNRDFDDDDMNDEEDAEGDNEPMF